MQFKSFNLQEFEHSSGPLRKQKVQELDQICQNSGFLLLSGHGVPLKIIRAQSQPLSYLSVDANRGSPETISTYIPGSLLLSSAPVPGRSVPLSCVT